MSCLNCNKEFEIVAKGSGGQNRVFCYECMPFNSDKRQRNKQRYDLLLQYSNKVKLDRGCDECGYRKCAKALEWHHPGDTKQYNPANAIHRSLEVYLREIAECTLLCANCHREHHSEID